MMVVIMKFYIYNITSKKAKGSIQQVSLCVDRLTVFKSFSPNEIIWSPPKLISPCFSSSPHPLHSSPSKRPTELWCRHLALAGPLNFFLSAFWKRLPCSSKIHIQLLYPISAWTALPTPKPTVWFQASPSPKAFSPTTFHPEVPSGP